MNASSFLQEESNPFLDWTANLFMASRWQFVLLANSRSLYSVVMLGKGITNQKTFVEKAIKSLREYMESDGLKDFFNTYIYPYTTTVTFSKIDDKRILGSLNDLIFQAKCNMLDIGLPLSLVNQRLNKAPMSFLNWRNPREALIELSRQRIS